MLPAHVIDEMRAEFSEPIEERIALLAREEVWVPLQPPKLCQKRAYDSDNDLYQRQPAQAPRFWYQGKKQRFSHRLWHENEEQHKIASKGFTRSLGDAERCYCNVVELYVDRKNALQRVRLHLKVAWLHQKFVQQHGLTEALGTPMPRCFLPGSSLLAVLVECSFCLLRNYGCVELGSDTSVDLHDGHHLDFDLLAAFRRRDPRGVRAAFKASSERVLQAVMGPQKIL